MFKKILLASATSFIAVAGALYTGAQAARADEGTRFMFRYSPAVLVTAATGDDGSESGGPGVPGEDGGTGETGHGDGGTGETDPGDGGGDADGGEEGEPAAKPGEIEFAPQLTYMDLNDNGVFDLGDYLRISFFGWNYTALDATNAVFELRFPMGDRVHTTNCEAALIAAENRTWCNLALKVTSQMIPGLGDPGEAVDFTGSVALVALNSETFGPDEYVMPTDTISLQLPGFVTPGTVAVSSSSLALLDADGDGHADAGEILRMTLGATSTSGLDAAGVGFEVRMPGFAPATCSLPIVAAGATRTCDVDFTLTEAALAALGKPGESVSLDAAASLTALDGLTYAFEQYPKASASVSFNLSVPATVAYLRLAYSGGWAFECRTDWTAAFLADNLEMTMVFWDRNKNVFVTPGADFKPSTPRLLSLRSSWFQIANPNYDTMTASLGGYLTPTGDPRGKVYNVARDGKACTDSVASIISHGDLATAHRVEIQSAEIIERVE